WSSRPVAPAVFRSRRAALGAGINRDPGDDLFSQGAAPSVSSALESLTAVFGMGTGVASPLESPGSLLRDDVTGTRRRFGVAMASAADEGAPVCAPDGAAEAKTIPK